MGKPARLTKPFGNSPIHVFLHFLVVENFFFQKLWLNHTIGGVEESRRRLGRGLVGRIWAIRLFYVNGIASIVTRSTITSIEAFV